MVTLTETSQWQALQAHKQQLESQHMRDLFATDPERYQRFSIATAGISLDYSKNRITTETLQLLTELAQERQLPAQINALFAGTFKNHSENSTVQHPRLRHYPEPADNMHQAMFEIAEQIRSGKRCNPKGQSFTDIVNLGIGGSDLGARAVVHALQPYTTTDIKLHFLSNIDSQGLKQLINKLDLSRTLFIVTSKSFTTTETLLNAETIRQYYPSEIVEKHFIAITAKPEKALAFGITPENTITFPDWVNGRFSVWSSVGLALAIGIGKDHFNDFLAGAREMDQHFHTAPLEQNMPVILALLSLWYTNFWDAQSQAVIPYDHGLEFFPAYLQQAHMESYGKGVQNNGDSIDYATGPLIWGGIGTNGQHAYHQLLHQGTHLIPVDFIVARQGPDIIDHHRRLLFANCLSQSRALMLGNDAENPQKLVPGNRPSNTLVLEKLSPKILGSLLALYEHKIFSLSVLWGINAFDQWGVELGKQIGSELNTMLQNHQPSDLAALDSSTQGLMGLYQALAETSD